MHHNDEPTESFSFAGHLIAIEWKPLSTEAIGAIRESIRKDNFFNAYINLFAGTMDRMTYDGKTIMRPQPRSGRRSGTNIEPEPIPGDFDPKTGELLLDRLISLAVNRTPFLATTLPFSHAFGEYADEDTPEENPTKSPAATKKDS
jgi:hypothetical protein